MNLKTVIIVNDFAFINGGVGKVAISTAMALAGKGIRTILFSGMGPADIDLSESGIEVICMDQIDILSDPNRPRAIIQGVWNQKAKKEFDRLLSQLDIGSTIVHFHSWTKVLSSSLFSVTARHGCRVAITLHDYFSFCPNGAFFNFQGRKICYNKPLSFSCLISNCDKSSYFHKLWRVLRQIVQNRNLWKNNDLTFITISALNRRILEENSQKEKIKIYNLRNPIELNKNNPVNIQDNTEYLFIGRLSAEKGADFFCEAISDLGLRGTVIGDGHMLKELKDKYPDINFTGWKKSAEMGRYIRKGRALVFPSLLYEGSPLTIVEIKSHGIPCIVPDKCAACEEIIDGETGYIFESGNLQSLKEAIMKIQQNDISVISSNIINRFNYQLYTMDTHIKNLLAVYSDLL